MASDMRQVEDSSASESLSDDDLRAKTLDLLDFPVIRRHVADRTSFPAARVLALGLTPSPNRHDVEDLQRETSEGIAFLEKAGDLALNVAEDASPTVDRAALEGTLTGLELLAVADSIEVLRRARLAVLGERATVPVLAGIAEGIPDIQDVQRGIRASIGRRGEVVDGATPILGDLRRQTREAYEKVTEALEGVIHSPVGRQALQDQVISIRGDRLVVQVKTELRQRVPGIVLDASNTGATLFIEPFTTVDLCNDWRELALEEERETARVLADLSAKVGAAAQEIKHGILLTARLDFILARARYSAGLAGVGVETPPDSVQTQSGDGRATVRLVGARHPLLGKEAVPITVHIGPGWSVLVVTGPNTGGKTVAMKTVGLLALMHQSGLHIPADEGSYLPVFDGVYADVGDQQSIQQSVSTFGSHMRNVVDILSHATANSLVLLDELGTSTDPEEGSALAKAILGNLAAEGVPAIATTHHRSVAAYAEAEPTMMNASVDLDRSNLRPTFHLTLGVPGRSYAMSVAEQLGLSGEIMESARSLLEPQHLRFEDWLNELQSDRQGLKARLQEADEAHARAEATGRELEARLKDLEERRSDIMEDMHRELEAQFEQVRKGLGRAEAALSWDAPAGEAPHARDVEEARAEMSSARDDAKELERTAPRQPAVAQGRPLAVGDFVEVRGLNVRGTVVSLWMEDNEAEVAAGDVRFRLEMSRISLAQEPEEPVHDGAEVGYEMGSALPPTELDLRGFRAEEALLSVDQFLDGALRDGLGSVRIIHGKGTGALRRAVRELLTNHPLAKSFAPEAPERGGDGATVVELT